MVDGSDYPIKKRVAASSDPVIVSVEAYTKYKAHAVVKHGGEVVGAVDRNGQTVGLTTLARGKWIEVFPGVEIKMDEDYMQLSSGTGFQDETWTIRIAVHALPIKILVKDREAWSCSRSQTAREAHYSIMVER